MRSNEMVKTHARRLRRRKFRARTINPNPVMTAVAKAAELTKMGSTVSSSCRRTFMGRKTFAKISAKPAMNAKRPTMVGIELRIFII